jgi:hypothetical protein
VKTFLLVAVLLLASTSTFGGGQHVIPDYATAQRSYFSTKLNVNNEIEKLEGVRNRFIDEWGAREKLQ